MQHQQRHRAVEHLFARGAAAEEFFEEPPIALDHAEEIGAAIEHKIVDAVVDLAAVEFVVEGMFDPVEEDVDRRVDAGIVGGAFDVVDQYFGIKAAGDPGERGHDGMGGDVEIVDSQHGAGDRAEGISVGDGEHRSPGLGHQGGGRAADKYFLEARGSLGAHDDEIDLFLFGEAEQGRDDLSLQQEGFDGCAILQLGSYPFDLLVHLLLRILPDELVDRYEHVGAARRFVSVDQQDRTAEVVGDGRGVIERAGGIGGEVGRNEQGLHKRVSLVVIRNLRGETPSRGSQF